MHHSRSIAAASITALALAGAACAPYNGPSPGRPAAQSFRAELTELNDSGAHAVVTMLLVDDNLTVDLQGYGFLPGEIHAQHIHGEGMSTCPDMSAAGADGILSAAEGAAAYGPIVKSLTVEGSTARSEGLNLPVMPMADADGRIDYSRVIPVPDSVAHDLADYQVVVHGIDTNGNGTYDFSAGPSELDPSLPLEGTAPAACGTIEPFAFGDDLLDS